MATVDLRTLEAELLATAEALVAKAVIPVMAQATADVAEAARRNAARVLTMRSRQLISSIRHELVVQANEAVGVISAGGSYQGLDVPYARLQEYGGTILPVNGRFLTIPVDYGLTGPGIPRYASVRHMPFAQWIPVFQGRLAYIVVDRRNDQLFYLVVTSSDVPARPYLRPALDQVAQTLPDRLAMAMAAEIAA